MEHTSQSNTQVKRGLKQRHLTMIALGGTIGTGLFVTSGATISQAGPIGSLVAYTAIGLMVFFLMTSLGEMAAYLPISGSFSAFASRYVGKDFGFAMGWNYWFNDAITVAVEAATVGVVMGFWLPHVPSWIWSAVSLILILMINLSSSRAYGEAEFWMSIIKVVAVIAFIVIGLLSIFGAFTWNGLNIGHNLSAGGHGGFVGGFAGILGVFMIAGFSFQGTEIVGIAAGESENPHIAVPKAIKQVFWRILIFYFISIFIIGALIYYKDPSLLAASNSNISVAPFTLIFQHAGLAAAAGIMNAVILTSVISAANSWLYAGSRTLYAMANAGDAPKVFGLTNKHGIPMNAVLATLAVGLLAFVTSIFGPNIYLYLVGASGLSGFLAWIGIAIVHFRFRRAYVAQGHKIKDLDYHARWFPVGPILAFVMSIIIVVGQITTISTDGGQGIQNIIVTYLALPLFLVLYFGYKIAKKSKTIPLEEVNLERDFD